MEREENLSTPRKTFKSGSDLYQLNPHMIAEEEGVNVEYNANLTSPGIWHRGTRMVALLGY